MAHINGGPGLDLRDLSELERITVAIQNALGTIIRSDQARRLKYLPEDFEFTLDTARTRDDIDESKPDFEAPSEVQPIRGFKILNPGGFSSGVKLLVDHKRGKTYDLAETSIENLRAFKVWILNDTPQPGKTVKIRFYVDPYILGTLSPRLSAELVKVVDGNNNLVDFATETTLATLLTEATFSTFADLTMTGLRDALRGTGNRTLTNLYDQLSLLESYLQSRTGVVASELSVGTTEVQGPNKPVAPGKGVVVAADQGNTDFVRLRQATGAANADSIRFYANQERTVFVDNFNRLFFIANSGAQIVGLLSEA